MADYVALKYIRVRDGFNVRGVLPNVAALADDIAERGQLEPIAVRKAFKHEGSELHHMGTWVVPEVEVVSGHRREAALKLLAKEKRSAVLPVAYWANAIGNMFQQPGGGTHSHKNTAIVDGDFPVAVTFREISDRDAKLENLAENAHKEGMRQVDVYRRASELLQDGVEPATVARALAIPEKRFSRQYRIFRRLNQAIVTRWLDIERPEHEPPWNLLDEIGKGGQRVGRGGETGVERVVAAPLHEQLAVWKKYYGEDAGKPVRARTFREPAHMRKIREVRAKRDACIAASKDPTALPGRVGQLQHFARALSWVLGETEDL